jgi:hypothetical protein
VLELEGAEPERMKAMLGGMEGMEEAQVFGATLRLRVAAGSAQRITQEVTAVSRDAGLPEIRVRGVPPSLEDVFRFLLQEGGEGMTL